MFFSVVGSETEPGREKRSLKLLWILYASSHVFRMCLCAVISCIYVLGKYLSFLQAKLTNVPSDISSNNNVMIVHDFYLNTRVYFSEYF